MIHTLMPLPFEEAALEPYISRETLQYHYGKHHAAYVKNLNALIEGTEYEDMGLEEIVCSASGAIFNNAAQVFNHDFYWLGMANPDSKPSAELIELVERDFGSFTSFKELFLNKAATLFGSGWVWFELDGEGKSALVQSSNADNPLTRGSRPLLTCDVWEHAYYIDYRNARADYLGKWWELIDWGFVSANLSNATKM